jgi:hypothetical protein
LVRIAAPAQGAALSEADSVFSALATSAAGPVQPASLLAVAQEDPEVEAFSPEQPGRAERGAEPRQARVLPDLLSLSRASEPLSPAAEKHSALSRKQQSPGMQEWAEPGAAETSPDLDQVIRFGACQQYGEPPEIEGPAPPTRRDRCCRARGFAARPEPRGHYEPRDRLTQAGPSLARSLPRLDVSSGMSESQAPGQASAPAGSLCEVETSLNPDTLD